MEESLMTRMGNGDVRFVVTIPFFEVVNCVVIFIELLNSTHQPRDRIVKVQRASIVRPTHVP